MPSSTAEDYLKIILQKTTDADTLVSVGEVAQGVHVVPGTATTMVKSLAEQGLIEYRPRQGVRLTEKGRKEALAVVRRHRLVEAFLVNVLKMSWSEVHEEAERLEHALSDKVLDRIDSLLGHPKADPHGDPIPSAHGKMDTRQFRSLADCREGADLRLVRISDQSESFLRFAESEGLVPGALCRLASLSPAAGTLELKFRAGRRLTLSLEKARKLLVETEARG